MFPSARWKLHVSYYRGWSIYNGLKLTEDFGQAILHLTRPFIGFNIILNLREYKISLYVLRRKCRSRHGLSNGVEFFIIRLIFKKL